MVKAISSGSVASASGGSDSAAQVAALEKQLATAQKQLAALQKGVQSDASKKEQQLLAQRIAGIEGQIARIQAAAAQASALQGAQTVQSAPPAARSGSPTLGTIIDTQA